MAYPTSGAQRGAHQQDYHQTPSDGTIGAAGRPVQVMGAAMSLALIVGLGYWGYSLAVRDAAGIPVVRALEGPMRVTPKDPGGQVAENTGLSVTTVAADGAASQTADEIAVATEMADLPEEDAPTAALRPQPRTQTAEAADAELVADTAAVQPTAFDQEALPADPVAAALALAEQVSQGAEPLAPQAEVAGTSQIIPASVPGVTRSLRPSPRPAIPTKPVVQPQTGQAAQITEITEVSASTAAPEEVAASAVPVGTRMVQLGAFDTPEDAATAWAVLAAQFDVMMEGKTRVVQEAASGGRNFYRLRAIGFDDLADARQFCAALVAERADCIPVVAR